MTSFYTFDEAVKAACAEPGIEFVGMKFVPPFSQLGIYIINVYPDEPDNINVFYEGGSLFDSVGEEDFYDLKDAPTEAKELFFACKTDLGGGDPQVMGSRSEFLLQQVLPGLSEDARYRDHCHFMQVAGAAFRAYWRQE